MINARLIFLLLAFGTFFSSGRPMVFGSYHNVSVQAQTIFSANTTNLAQGFTNFQQGFYLSNNASTVTYSCEHPVQCSMGLWGGTLSLNSKLVLANPSLVLNTGTIYANNNTIEFAKGVTQQVVPNDIRYYTSISTLQSVGYGAAILSCDYAYDSSTLVVSTVSNSNGAEFNVTFPNGTNTTVKTGYAINSVRWYPTDYYVAYGMSQGNGNEICVYYANQSNHTLSLITSTLNSSTSGDNVTAVAWNNTGSYLAAGKVAASQLLLYSFSTGSGTLTQLATASLPVSGDSVAKNAIVFSPQSTYLAVGTSRASAGANLLIYNTSAGSLALNASIDPGYAVLSVDYSSTGSYVAVGLSGATNNLQIYQHNPVAGTLTLITSASLGGSTYPGNCLTWDHTGRYLAVGTSTSGYALYYFDPCTQILQPQTTNTSAFTTNAICWSSDGNLIGLGQSIGYIPIVQPSYTHGFIHFDSATLDFHSPIALGTSWKFSGMNKISGKNNVLTIPQGTQILLYPNSSLIFQDLTIAGLGLSNVQCLADNASVTFRNCNIRLASDYTFTAGSLFFDKDVVLSGTVKFSYAGDQPCTILSGATLYVDSGMTFSYSPSVANTQLLNFVDQTSTLYLNHCTFYSTSTTVNLTQGSLFFDSLVTFTSEARNSGEAPILGSSVLISMQGGAVLDIHGFVKYL